MFLVVLAFWYLRINSIGHQVYSDPWPNQQQDCQKLGQGTILLSLSCFNFNSISSSTQSGLDTALIVWVIASLRMIACGQYLTRSFAPSSCHVGPKTIGCKLSVPPLQWRWDSLPAILVLSYSTMTTIFDFQLHGLTYQNIVIREDCVCRSCGTHSLDPAGQTFQITNVWALDMKWNISLFHYKLRWWLWTCVGGYNKIMVWHVTGWTIS